MGAVPGQSPYTPSPGGFGPQGGGYGPQQGGFAPNAGYGAGPGGELDVGWLLWGAIGMMFCCQPCGIAGLVLMDQAKTAHRIGDTIKAEQKLATMKTVIFVGIGLGVAFILFYVVMIAIGVSAAILGGP